MIEKDIKAVIEAILFSAGRIVTEEEIMMSLEINKEEIMAIGDIKALLGDLIKLTAVTGSAVAP